jgi:protoporphyrinogen oxidase
MAYGAAGHGRRLLDRSDGEIAEIVVSGLRSIFPEAGDIVEEVEIQRWEIGIPYSTPGRHRHQAALEERLGPIALAGDYIGERAGMDTAVTTAIEAADGVRALLGREAARLPVSTHWGRIPDEER